MTIILRAALCSGVGAALFGTVLGLSTAGAIRPPAAASGPIYPRSAMPIDPILADSDTECSGCTRYDEGYRWASAQGLSDTDACFGDDWSHQRGCLAFVATTRLD